MLHLGVHMPYEGFAWSIKWIAQAELEDGDIIDMMVTQIGGSC